jgi:hypothetical protein
VIDKLSRETIPDYLELLGKDCSALRGYDRMRSERSDCEMPINRWNNFDDKDFGGEHFLNDDDN